MQINSFNLRRGSLCQTSGGSVAFDETRAGCVAGRLYALGRSHGSQPGASIPFALVFVALFAIAAGAGRRGVRFNMWVRADLDAG